MGDRDAQEENDGVFKNARPAGPSRLEGGAYGGVREHGQAARTPLTAFFNIPYVEVPTRYTVKEYPASFQALMPPFMDHTLL